MHDGVNSHGMARFEMNFDHMFSKHVAFDGVRRRAGLFLKYLMVHRLDLFQTSSVLDSFHRWYIFATGVLLSKPMEPSQWLLWCRTHPHVSVELSSIFSHSLRLCETIAEVDESPGVQWGV